MLYFSLYFYSRGEIAAIRELLLEEELPPLLKLGFYLSSFSVFILFMLYSTINIYPRKNSNAVSTNTNNIAIKK